MSRSSSSPKPDSVLNLTPATNHPVGSPNVSVSSSEMLPESSCLSSEADNNYEDPTSTAEYGGSCPKVTAPMLLVGCPRCFMYVMLSEVDPKCPQCKSTVFLDFLNQEIAKWARN